MGQATAFGEDTVAELTPLVQLKFASNVNNALVTEVKTGSGTITHETDLAVMSTTANANSSANILSKRILRYNAGQGCRFVGAAIFTQGVAGSEQVFGVGDANDGFFFGFDGANFGIKRLARGVATWVHQTDWSLDKFTRLDPTKGNVFKIQYRWLGFGAINFFVEDGGTGKFVNVHRISYANTATEPSISNPSMPLCAMAKNTTNNTNIVLKTSSMAGFIEGKDAKLGVNFVAHGTKTVGVTTLQNVLSIQNKATFQGDVNRVQVELNSFDINADGTKPVEIQVIINPTFTLGTPIFTDVNTNTSVMGYFDGTDTITAGTGTIIKRTTLSREGSKEFTQPVFELYPSDILTIVATATSGTSDIKASIGGGSVILNPTKAPLLESLVTKRKWYQPAKLRWRLNQDWRYKFKGVVYIIPAGYETDLASIPRLLWTLYPPNSWYDPAVLEHDHLYGNDHHGHERKDSDIHMRQRMKEINPPAWFARWSFYRVVRRFGGIHRLLTRIRG